jgi:regulator of protease activity HflC (stomatin/prohibitin superfamily)
MTEYDASDLLSRLRADREGIMETRRLLAQSRLSTPSSEAALSEDANGLSDAEVVVMAGSYPDLVAPEEMGIIREIRAKVERVDARLTSLHEWVAETRAWTERVELAHRAQCDLGRLVLESQLRVDQQVRDAEERAAQIVAEAEEQARELLAAAEVAAAEVTAAAAQEPAAPQTPGVATSVEPESHDKVELSPEEAEAEELYDAIELFTRTNAELVHELGALLSTIPAREPRH